MGSGTGGRTALQSLEETATLLDAPGKVCGLIFPFPVSRPLESSREPRGWGGAISSWEGNSFQDLKPRDSEAADSDYQQSTLPFRLGLLLIL